MHQRVGVKGDRRSGGGKVGGGISSNGTNSRATGKLGFPWWGSRSYTPVCTSAWLPAAGKTKEAEERILAEAIALEQAGAFVWSIFNAVGGYAKASDSDDWHWCRTAL